MHPTLSTSSNPITAAATVFFFRETLKKYTKIYQKEKFDFLTHFYTIILKPIPAALSSS